MKIALLTGLIASGIAIAQPIQAALTDDVSPAISQIVITSYTGSDTPRSKVEPFYRILLKSDGTAIYVGSKTYMKRTGRYRGTIAQSDFAKLAALFQKNDFQSSYNVSTDNEIGKETFAVTSGNQKKTIVSYQESGPQDLQMASKIAYGLIWKINWTKVSSSDAISG